MGLYSRSQLWVLLAITALGGAGLAVGAWRRAHPELAVRLERFDAAPASPSFPTSIETPRTGQPPLSTTRASPPRRDRMTRSRFGSDHPSVAPPDRVDKRQRSDGPLDLNRATLEDLRRLPGIGPALARRIVVARERSGRFAAVDDLESVPGVGAGKLARLRDFVTVSP